MAIFIIGHGVREPEDPEAKAPDWTVVPPGGAVTFFTASGSNLLMADGLAALEANSREFGYTYDGGAPIENYRLSRLADDERQLFETVQGNTATLAGALYVGDGGLDDGVRLCESKSCRDGVHRCGGVLHRFPGPLIVLACRGDGVSSTGQTTFGTTSTGALFEKYEADLEALSKMTWFAAGEWLYELATYDRNDPDADAQVKAAYLLTHQTLSTALGKFNSFCEYFSELQARDFTNVEQYIELYDSLKDDDLYRVEMEWDADNRVNAAVESWKDGTDQPPVEELLAGLDALLDSTPTEDTPPETGA